MRQRAATNSAGPPLRLAIRRGMDRQRGEWIDWQARRFITAADRFGIPVDQVTMWDLIECVAEGLIPGLDAAPTLRVDRRYGPRTPQQLVTRAARQAERKASSA